MRHVPGAKSQPIPGVPTRGSEPGRRYKAVGERRAGGGGPTVEGAGDVQLLLHGATLAAGVPGAAAAPVIDPAMQSRSGTARTTASAPSTRSS